jgi:DnaB-like helicase N terminal domain/AAA domain/Homeodomain-like domain
MPTSHSDAIQQTERALLGSILLTNSLWPQTNALSSDNFSLDSHRKLYARIAAMFEDQRPVDVITLTEELARLNQLEGCGGEEYIASLLDDVVPENIAAYVRSVRTSAVERRIEKQIEAIAKTGATNSREKLTTLREQTERLLESLSVGDGCQSNWQSLFHSYEEFVSVPPVTFAIEGFLQQEGITLIGGLAGHGKTLCMLAMARALLEGGKLFHHFPVNKPAERVIYLIPEAGLGPFASRLKTFHLEDSVRDGRLLFRTLSAKGSFSLSDARLLEAVKGADVFLDTAVRFMEGDENSASEQRMFAESLFSLQRAGARTITGAHHSPKSFGKETSMTLENVLRGSGDIGAMLCTAWGLSQIDSGATRVYVQNVKARDFLPCAPFIIQGRPSINESGFFELTNPPGFAGSLGDSKAQAGRPEMTGKEEKRAMAAQMKGQGKSYRDIAQALEVSTGTVSGWLTKN